MTENEIYKPKGHVKIQWAYTILCNLSVFTYGLQSGWISPMMKILQSEQSPTGTPLTDAEISWLASSTALAGVAGVILFLQLVDRFGRKKSILVMIVFQALSWIIIMLPANTTSLIVARISSGIGGGGCFHIVPMYVKEIAQDSIRGTLASLLMFSQSSGILIMYILGGFFDYYTVLWIVFGIPILVFFLFLKAPEPPAFLIKKGKSEKAAETLAFLRGLDDDDKIIQSEINVIKKDDEYFKSIPDISIITVFKTKAWRKAFLIMFLVMLTHALNGSFCILNYAAVLLSDSGIQISPELQSLSIPICMTTGSFVMMAIVDKVGRKPILAVAHSATAIAFTCIATSILLQKHGYVTPSWLNITMMMISICAFGGGIAPIPFIVIPEIFNFQIRAKLMGYLVMLGWFLSFVQLIAFGAISSNYGAHVGFYVFVVINILGAITAFVILPETKGKTVEEIEAELGGVKKIAVEEKLCDKNLNQNID